MPDDDKGTPNPLAVTLQLSAPVTAYGEQVTSVTLRPPTVAELRKCGQPYVVAGGLKADYEACARLLECVCTPPLPGPTVNTLDPADFDDLAMILVGFTKRAPRGGGANPSPPTALSTRPAT